MANSSPNESLLDFEDLAYLGAGSYAQVRKVRYKGNIAAVKVFKQFKQGPKYFMKEVYELRKVNHPNIIKLLSYGKWKDRSEDFNCMIIEFADMGSLHHVLYETDLNYTLEHGVSWLYQCSDAIKYLHSMTPKPTIHRDLKPLNLLLMNGGQVLKVCDFGTASDLKTRMTIEQGSPCWIAPEMLIHEHYNEKCDVYSYAIIAWEVICRLSPYFGTNYSSTQIMFGVTRAENPLRPKEISNCPKIFKLLIERSLDGDPDRRPSMHFIYEVMKSLDSLLNREPIKPLVSESDEDKDTKSINHETSDKTILNTNGGGIGTTTQRTETIIQPPNANNTPTITETSPSPVPSELSVIRRQPPNKNMGHRKSRSYGNDFIVVTDFSEQNLNLNTSSTGVNNIGNSSTPTTPSIETPKVTTPGGNRPPKPQNLDSIEEIKNELSTRMETMLYDPLEPLYNNNESIQIFNEHRNLIKNDEILQKKINNLKAQSDQLHQTLKNIDTYNELLKQKNLLISENTRLRNLLK